MDRFGRQGPVNHSVSGAVGQVSTGLRDRVLLPWSYRDHSCRMSLSPTLLNGHLELGWLGDPMTSPPGIDGWREYELDLRSLAIDHLDLRCLD
ncbi:hypothetical protein ACLOJK_023384, partial [Asimina triloba]